MDTEKGPLTVRELIAELQKHDLDLLVETEGCDCDGDVGRVTVETHGDYPAVLGARANTSYVYLNRSR